MKLGRVPCEASADKDGLTIAPLVAGGAPGAGAHALRGRIRQDDFAPLHLAPQAGHLKLGRMLCEASADKDEAKQNGVTPYGAL